MMSQIDSQSEILKIFLDAYSSRIQEGDPLQRIRSKYWDHFLQLGLPNRQSEVYRYIKLRQLFSQSYALAEDKEIDLDAIQSSVLPECQESVLVFVNGYYHPELSNLVGLPSKLAILPLSEAMPTYGTFINNYFAQSIKEEKDPFASLNRALHKQGLFIYIPPKTIVERPIQLLNILQPDDKQSLMMMPSVNIFVGVQSDLTLASTYKRIGEGMSYFVNEATQIVLEEDSHVRHTQDLCDERSDQWHLAALRATLKKNSTLKTIAATKGSATVRLDYHIALIGENSEALLNGVWMLEDKREAHINILIDHQAPNCRSYQLFKGVLNDFSRSSFEGKIMVRQLAQKTEAFQLNNNLLLNDYTHADSKPNLEIFADDVKASHGSTIGQLDQDQLFYLRTRGIDEKFAKNLLIYGFCEQVVDLIQIPSLKDKISQTIRRYLGNKQE